MTAARVVILRAGLMAAAATLWSVGCASAIVMPNEADVGALRARYPDATLPSLQRGRELFVARCTGCHHLPLPATKTPEQWSEIVKKMAPDAKLSDDDRALIERYLFAASARSHPISADVTVAASR